MTDRPILFSAPMVRALLDGRKTQTRRIFKPRGFEFYTHPVSGDRYNEYRPYRDGTWDESRISGGGPMRPFGWGEYLYAYLPHAPGDRLWVKETWRAHAWHSDCVEIAYAAQHGLVGWSEQHAQIRYPDGDRNAFKYYAPKGPDFWRPSLFMPRWASRLTLFVTDVRVERLQDISEEDAEAEGVERDSDGWRDYLMPQTQCCASAVDSYRTLWDSINGEGAWDANPWVVAYTFRVIKQNIDQIERAAA